MHVYKGLVEPTSSTFIFTIVNTIVLFLILKKILFKPVKEFMEARQKGIEDSISEAEKLNLEAKQLKEEYQSKLDNIKEEGREIVKAARMRADEQSKEIIKEAQNKSSRMIERAEEEIEREQIKAMNQLKDKVGSLALITAEKILEAKLDEKEHDKMVQKFVKEVGEAKWQN
ncbi:MAG: F0F1 ATP synthase subunit B [Clostridia bacterium]|nr:F0F1 ATP synthase subunit B [Clostridia bacterium]